MRGQCHIGRKDLPEGVRLLEDLDGESREQEVVRADLSGHLKYSRRWSGVCAGVLLGAQGAVRRGENRGGL